MVSGSLNYLPSLARAEVAMKNRRKAAAEAVPDFSRESLRLNQPMPTLLGRDRSEHELRTSEARYRQALEATQTALTRTEALYRVSTALVAANSVGALLHRVVDAVAEALPAYRVHLMAVDVERRLVLGHYRGGPGSEPPADIDYAEMMEGLGGWVLTHRVATLSPGNVPDPRESPRVVARRVGGVTRLGPLMVAPLLYGDRPLGIIVACRSSDQPDFVQADVDLLSAMASQAAVAIESASVHEQLKAAHQELEDRVAQRTAQLAESEDRYRRITETMTDYVFRVQVIGGVAISTRHGPGCVAVTGYTAEDFAKDPGLWLRLVVPEDRALVLEQTADVEANRRMRPVEHRIVRKDGSLRWVRSTPVPQYAPDGTLLGYDGLIQDITERRALEAQLIQAQKMESIGRLAGGVAHDFNNLLTAIMGNAELALMDLGPNHPARESIAEVVKAAEGAARLTSQLLAFARKQIIEPASLDLSAVVAGSLEMLRRLLGEGIEISAVLDSGLGTIEADLGQIQQLLVNLTVNARDAMPEGGTLVIETANETVGGEYATSHPDIAPGPYVRLSVTDTGTGMTEETMSHLFEPFFTTKGPGKGTGLGLATCHGIVQQNGGHIWVHSELGQGTTVTTLLPQVAAPARPADGVVIPPPPATGTETVLVVEDNPSVRRLSVLGLRSHGYTVLEAANAADALDIAARAPALDMLVTDVVMPGMQGPELAARLHRVRPAAKLLLMSGHTDTMEAFRDSEGRPIQLLQKPFTPERLARKVREILDAQ